MINDNTSIGEIIGEYDFYDYLGLSPKNSLFNFSWINGREECGYELIFNDVIFFRIYHSDDGNDTDVFLEFMDSDVRSEIIRYLGLNTEMDICTYGGIKKVLYPYIRLIEKYDTTNLNLMLLYKLQSLENKLNPTNV